MQRAQMSCLFIDLLAEFEGLFTCQIAAAEYDGQRRQHILDMGNTDFTEEHNTADVVTGCIESGDGIPDAAISVLQEARY